MELPHVGNNCALRQCNRLDFLPVKCDACSEVFCVQHYRYESHNCANAGARDVQVPVCPLCSQPVAGRRGQLPDVAVSEHMDQYCASNELLRDQNRPKRPQTSLQSCSFKSCKQKDLIYLECADCNSKFCIRHRHPADHSCSGPSVAASLATNWNSFRGSCSSSASSSLELLKNKAHQIGRSSQAVLDRLKPRANNCNTTARGQSEVLQSLQGGLSEQEALAIALDESADTRPDGSRRAPCDTSTANSSSSNRSNNNNNNNNNGNGNNHRQQLEAEDAALARALQESALEAQQRQLRTTTTARQRDTCVMS